MSRNTRPPYPNAIDQEERGGTRPYALHAPNADRVKYGIPRWLRRYNKRYGSSIESMLAQFKKNPA